MEAASRLAESRDEKRRRAAHYTRTLCCINVAATTRSGSGTRRSGKLWGSQSTAALAVGAEDEGMGVSKDLGTLVAACEGRIHAFSILFVCAMEIWRGSGASLPV